MPVAAVVTVSVSVGLVTFPKVAVMFVVPVASVGPDHCR